MSRRLSGYRTTPLPGACAATARSSVSTSIGTIAASAATWCVPSAARTAGSCPTSPTSPSACVSSATVHYLVTKVCSFCALFLMSLKAETKFVVDATIVMHQKSLSILCRNLSDSSLCVAERITWPPQISFLLSPSQRLKIEISLLTLTLDFPQIYTIPKILVTKWMYLQPQTYRNIRPQEA